MNLSKIKFDFKMEDNMEYLRAIMLLYFRKGKNAIQTTKKICKVEGVNVVNERMVQRLFKQFSEGDFSLKDAQRSGRNTVVDNAQIYELIDQDPHLSTREIGNTLDISKSTVANHLHQLGMVPRYDVWVPHKLSEKNLIERISVCDSLLKRNKNELLLKRIVTGDEKWIFL